VKITESLLRNMIRKIIKEESLVKERVSKILKSSERYEIESPEKVKSQGSIIVTGFKDVEVYEHRVNNPIIAINIKNEISNPKGKKPNLKGLGVNLTDDSSGSGLIKISPLGKTIQIVKDKYGGVEQSIKLYVPMGMKEKVKTR